VKESPRATYRRQACSPVIVHLLTRQTPLAGNDPIVLLPGDTLTAVRRPRYYLIE
jgi:hypothetical protein